MKNGKTLLRFKIGLITSLAFTLVAFEWKTFDSNAFICNFPIDPWEVHEIEDEVIPIRIERTHVEPPKPIRKDQIKIVIEPTVIEPDPVIETPKKEVVIIDVPFLGDENIIEDIPIPVAEISPEFPGGVAAMYKFLYDNIDYSPVCREALIEGTVYAHFVVGKNGKIRDISILRGIDGCKALEKEVIEALEKMPIWTPGKQAGRKVSVEFMIPVTFEVKS